MKEINEDTEKAYTLLITLIKKFNWEIAIPNGGGEDDDGMLHGMIIGEQSYVDYVLKHLE